MIKVTRIDAPAILTTRQFEGKKELKSGPRETEEAVKVFSKKKTRRAATFSFKIYNHEEVKKKLNEQFRMKCAYCEWKYEAGISGEVEHWRPKGSVKLETGKEKRPGYYWLAANWENLLAACNDCNRPRKYLLDPEGKRKVTLGKSNRFPIVNGTTYADWPEEEQKEKPLLLNPCVDDPADHLEFLDTGDKAGLVQAKVDRNGVRSERGEWSIQVYGLIRPGLVNTRKEHLLRIQKVLSRVENLHRRLDKETDQVHRLQAEGDLREARDELNEFLEPDKPFLQMARQIIGKFKRDRGIPD